MSVDQSVCLSVCLSEITVMKLEEVMCQLSKSNSVVISLFVFALIICVGILIDHGLALEFFGSF